MKIALWTDRKRWSVEVLGHGRVCIHFGPMHTGRREFLLQAPHDSGDKELWARREAFRRAKTKIKKGYTVASLDNEAFLRMVELGLDTGIRLEVGAEHACRIDLERDIKPLAACLGLDVDDDGWVTHADRKFDLDRCRVSLSHIYCRASNLDSPVATFMLAIGWRTNHVPVSCEPDGIHLLEWGKQIKNLPANLVKRLAVIGFAPRLAEIAIQVDVTVNPQTGWAPTVL